MSIGVQTDINSFLFINSDLGKKVASVLEKHSYLYDGSISFLAPTPNYLQYLESLDLSVGQTIALEHKFYTCGADPVFIFENNFENFKFYVNSINEGVIDFLGKAKDTILGFLKGAYDSYMDDGWALGSLHLVLDLLTILPSDWFGLPIPEVAGVVNGTIYLFQHRWLDAVLSFVAAIPFAHFATGFRTFFKFKGVTALFDAIRGGNVVAASAATKSLKLDQDFIKAGGMGFLGFVKDLLKDGVKLIYKSFKTIITGVAKAAGYISKPAEAKILGMLNNPMIKNLENIGVHSDEWIKALEKEEGLVTPGKAVIGPMHGKIPGTTFNTRIASSVGKDAEKLFLKPTLSELRANPIFLNLSAAQKVSFEKAWATLKTVENAETLFTKGASIASTKEGIELAKTVAHYTSSNPIKLLSKAVKPEEIKALSVSILSDPALTRTLNKGDVVFLKTMAEHPQAYIDMLKSLSAQKQVISRALKTGKVNMTVVTAFRGFLMMTMRYILDRGYSAGCPPECIGRPKQAGVSPTTPPTIEEIQKKFMEEHNIQSDNRDVLAACRETAQKIYDTNIKIFNDGKTKPGCNDGCETALALASTVLNVQEIHGTGPGNAFGQNTVSNVTVDKAGEIENKNMNASFLAPLGMPPVEEVMNNVYDTIPDYEEKMHFLCIVSIQDGSAILDDSQAMKVAKRNIDWLVAKGKIPAEQGKRFEAETLKIVNDRIKAKGGTPQPESTEPGQPEQAKTVMSPEEWIKDILDFETSKGYHNFGFTKQSAPQFSNENDAIAQFKTDYLPMVQDLPEAIQPVAADFAFNSENPKASLMVAAGQITPQQKLQLYTGGKLDNDKVNELWNRNKNGVIDKFNADKKGFLDAFDAERVRSYSNTNGANVHLDEWKERVLKTRSIADKILQQTGTPVVATA